MRRALPPRPFLDAIAIRVAVLWLFLRGVGSVGSSAAGIPYPDALVGPPLSGLWVTAVIVLAIRVDMRRQSELVFLANLGYSFVQILTFIVALSFLFEVTLRVAIV